MARRPDLGWRLADSDTPVQPLIVGDNAAVMALAATGRSFVQIFRQFDEAPLAYALSALAAAIYLVAVVALAKGGWTALRVATVSCAVELAGVLGVGTWSYVEPSAFPDRTVWSHFGSGYGYLPLVLPFLGLAWLVRTRPSA